MPASTATQRTALSTNASALRALCEECALHSLVNHRATLNNDALIGRITRLVERLTAQLQEEESGGRGGRKTTTPQHERRRLAREIEEYADEQRERIGRQAVRLGEQGGRIARVREGVVRVGGLLCGGVLFWEGSEGGEEGGQGVLGQEGEESRGDGGDEQSRRDDEQSPPVVDINYGELQRQTEEQACQVATLWAELADQLLRTLLQARELAVVVERFSRARRDMDRGGPWRAPGRSRET